MKKLMKRWVAFPMLVLGCLMGTVACSDDDEKTVEVPKAEFKLNAESVSMTADGGSSSITYTLKDAGANSAISATSDQQWVSNFKTATEGKITFDVAANPEAKEREAKITVVYSDDANEDIKTSFIVKQTAADLDFVITIGETGSSWIKLSLIPKDNSMRYMLAALPVDDLDGYTSDEAFVDSEMSMLQELADYVGIPLEQVVNILFSTGPITDESITLLEPDTEYYVYCYGINGDNELATSLVKQKVTTPAATLVDNEITISIGEVTARSATAKITTTTLDSYILVYAPSAGIAGATDQELLEELLAANFQAQAGNDDNAVFDNLAPDTEYTVIALGCAGGVATTGLVKATFKTKEGEVSNVTYSLPDKKYFDALEVKELYPSMFSPEMTITANDVIIAANIKADGAKRVYSAVFTKSSIDRLEETNGTLTEEHYRNLALNYGETYSNILTIVEYNLPLVLVGVAIDANGNYSKVYKEDITITVNDVSPVEEFGTYLAASRRVNSLLPAASVSSMRSVLMKNRTDNNRFKSYTRKSVRSPLKK